MVSLVYEEIVGFGEGPLAPPTVIALSQSTNLHRPFSSHHPGLSVQFHTTAYSKHPRVQGGRRRI